MSCGPGLQIKNGLCRAVCPCGWTSGDWQHPRNKEHVLAAERAHLDAAIDAMNPVVKAKIDELIETGNRHGVTPELIDDVITVIGDPRA